MSLRDQPLTLFDPGPRDPKVKRTGKRQTLARKCWNECALSVEANGDPILIPACPETDNTTCEYCDGPLRLTVVHVEPDIVETLLKKADRLQHIIRAQNQRRRYATRKGT